MSKLTDFGLDEEEANLVMHGNKEMRGSSRKMDKISEDNKVLIRTAMNLWNLPKINTSDPNEVAERCNYYFGLCLEEGLKPSVAGLALALGTNRNGLSVWMTGSQASKQRKPESVIQVIKNAKAVLNSLMEDYMEAGKINPVSGIFLLKNNFEGYADKSEVVLTPNNTLGDTVDKGELERKYLESLPDCVEDDE